MSKVFTAVVSPKEGTMSLVMGEHEVIMINRDGDLTLFGPDHVVLREYTESEVDSRQKELDDELKSIFDGAYDEGDGAIILDAFAVLGANMEVILSMSEHLEDNDEPSTTLN